MQTIFEIKFRRIKTNHNNEELCRNKVEFMISFFKKWALNTFLQMFTRRLW